MQSQVEYTKCACRIAYARALRHVLSISVPPPIEDESRRCPRQARPGAQRHITALTAWRFFEVFKVATRAERRNLAASGQAYLPCVSMQNQHPYYFRKSAGTRCSRRTKGPDLGSVPVSSIASHVKHEGDLFTRGLISHEFRTCPWSRARLATGENGHRHRTGTRKE